MINNQEKCPGCDAVVFSMHGNCPNCGKSLEISALISLQEGERVYRWVKAVERLPEPEILVKIRSGNIEDLGERYTLYHMMRDGDMGVEWEEQIPAPIHTPVSKETDSKDEIRKMAEVYANSKFAPQSFRWQHMVRIYVDAINEWIISKITKGERDNEEKPPYSMPAQSYWDRQRENLKKSAPPIPETLPTEKGGMEMRDEIFTDCLALARQKEDCHPSPGAGPALFMEGCYQLYDKLQPEINSLQASLSSMKAERDNIYNECLGFADRCASLGAEITMLTADRDLYKAESESYRKAWEEATAIIEVKNLEIAKLKEEQK